MIQTLPGINKPDRIRQVIHGTYYPHIDGIRAFAVLPVVLFHILASLCPGGFGGVDVFFVISGYLITGGVFRDLERGQFSIGNFYHRRIRRILPAYFMLLAGVFAVGCVVYYALPLMNLGDAAISGTLFSANIFFYKFYGNYFATDLHNNPLLHLWSLSVEEQFYLVIPLLCAVLWKYGRRLLTPVLVLLAVLSLVASIHAVGSGRQDSAFYLLHFRAWELLAGALLSILPSREPGATPQATAPARYLRAALPVLGVLLLLLPYALLRSARPFPGLAALPLVGGTACLIRYGRHGWANTLLSWEPLVIVGRISYSLYLWHWPIILFWKYIVYDQLTPWDYLGMLVVSLLVSWLSWKYVEMPVRLAKTWTPRYSVALAAAGIALFLTLGMSCIASQGWMTRLHVRANAMSATGDYTSRIMRMLFVAHKRLAALSGVYVSDTYWQWFGREGDYALGAPGRTPELFLLGDSHCGMLQYGMDTVLRDTDHGALAIIRPSTPMFELGGTDCRYALEVLARHPEATKVLLVQKWDGYLPTSGATSSRYDELTRFARRIRGMRRKLYIVTQVPCRDESPSDIAARVRMIPPRRLERGWDDDGRQPVADYEQHLGTINQQLRAVCLATGAVLVPMHQAFRQGDAYLAFAGTSATPVPLYKDANHLTKAGSLQAATYVMSYLFPSR